MKSLFTILSVLVLFSCDLKDKQGNAPLIEDEKGYLVDNPNYKSDEYYEYLEKKAKTEAKFDEVFKDAGKNMQAWADSATAADKKAGIKQAPMRDLALEDRINFAKTFKPKTSPTTVSLSGKDKTTIIFTSAFTVPYTVEQYDNLNYFHVFRTFGFKKVIFSNGEKTVATKIIE